MYKATITGKRQITIPKEICNLLNIKSGDQITFRCQDDGTVIFKNNTIDNSTICPYCGKEVFKLSPNVCYEGQLHHLECWFENHTSAK